MRRAVLLAAVVVSILVVIALAGFLLGSPATNPSKTGVSPTNTGVCAGLGVVSGTLTVAETTGTNSTPASGNGTLTINVKNAAASPITLATLNLEPADGSLTVMTGGTVYSINSTALTIYSGVLRAGQSTTFEAQASGITANSTYIFSVRIDISGCNVQTLTLGMMAQVAVPE